MGDMFLISGMQQVDACIVNCDHMLRDIEIVIVGDLQEIIITPSTTILLTHSYTIIDHKTTNINVKTKQFKTPCKDDMTTLNI